MFGLKKSIKYLKNGLTYQKCRGTPNAIFATLYKEYGRKFKNYYTLPFLMLLLLLKPAVI